MELAIGVSASLIGGLILWLFTDYLIPLLKGNLINVPNISGKWEGYDIVDDAEVQTSTFTIKQVGTKIRAKAIRRIVNEPDKVFTYKGKYQSGQLIFTWMQSGGENYIVGTMILYITGNLQELRGSASYVSQDDNNPENFNRVKILNKVYRKVNI